MELENRILYTLKWFSLQQMPLTLLELYRYLTYEPGRLSTFLNNEFELEKRSEFSQTALSVREVLEALDLLLRQGRIYFSLGYYCLPVDLGMCTVRSKAYIYGLRREKLIRRYGKWLKFLPFISGVAVAGSQALGDQKEKSDIDLLIVTKEGWLWLPRTLVTIYFQIFGVRRHGQKIANRFCLNHYVAQSKKVKIYKNLYTAMEYAKLRSLTGGNEIRSFQEVNSFWIKTFFPNLDFGRLKENRAAAIKRFFEYTFSNRFGCWLERVLENLQKPRIHTEEKYVVVEDGELSFHPNSKQQELLSKFFKSE